MPHILTIAELCDAYMAWTADVAVQIIALEEMGAIGLNIGGPTYEVVPVFAYS